MIDKDQPCAWPKCADWLNTHTKHTDFPCCGTDDDGYADGDYCNTFWCHPRTKMPVAPTPAEPTFAERLLRIVTGGHFESLIFDDECQPNPFFVELLLDDDNGVISSPWGTLERCVAWAEECLGITNVKGA